MLYSEALKLKRSWVWVICLIIPLLSVTLGALNFARNQEQLDSGWISLSSQAGLFYALIFFSVGSAVILSTIWRPDLNKSNWNAVLCSYKKPWAIFAIKALLGAALIVFMHLVFLMLTIATAWALGVKDIELFTVARDSLVVIIAAFPLAVFQSLLSFLLRSYAWPIAVCLVLCVAGFAVVSSDSVGFLIYLLPQPLAAYAIAAPSAAFAIDTATTPLITQCLIAAIIQVIVYFGLSIAVFKLRQR